MLLPGHTAAMASWWYCLVHDRVEGDEGDANMSRLGPYATREEAEQAPERVRQRTAAQDARDEAEDDWGTPPARR